MKRLVLAILVVLSLAAAANAQTFRGTILGTVTDSSGLAVAGATVTVKNTDTGLLRTTQTTADGSYSVTELPIGTYAVTISQSGFGHRAAPGGDHVKRIGGSADKPDRPRHSRERPRLHQADFPQSWRGRIS